MKSFITLLLTLIIWGQMSAQKNSTINGKIGSVDEKGNHAPLVGVNVYYLGTQISAVTDANGEFTIAKADSLRYLITSYVGFVNDTIDTKGKTFIHTMLEQTRLLDEVEIEYRIKGTDINTLDPLNATTINQRELQKAACCNLSESFETNPSIDVSFTDAVTGTRQIQMLGLAGPNILVTREMIPDLRGLATIDGLQYVPGTWIESIQLNKGSGSVVNGFESVVGQMNVELKKAESGEKAMLNMYLNSGTAAEFNANVRSEISPKLSTASMIQVRNLSNENDMNKDGFMDMPVSDRFIGLHRWKYTGGNGLFAQIGVRGVYLNNTGGQLSNTEPIAGASIWKMHRTTKRVEAWMKIGKVWNEQPWKSTGLQISAITHDVKADYGKRTYSGIQNSLYANWIYQSIISNTNHQVKAGISYQLDDYKEDLKFDSTASQYLRNEQVPGSFFEYTFLPNDRFTMVSGIRADYHNNYDRIFVSPRIHMRYALFEKTTIKLSGGKSFRTANIFAENQQVFASSRNVFVSATSNPFANIGIRNNTPYGLQAEEAWNYGLNVVQKFNLDYREGAISLDLYQTQFTNQIVVDYDINPQTINFYNLEGQSYSNSAQIQLDYELINRLDLRLAYRWLDVKTDYFIGKLDKPLISNHRAFVNLGYRTPNFWSFDWTLNWNGAKRIPSTASNPTEFQRPTRSPDFFLMNAQITKSFREVFDVYLGGENLADYRQSNPIISAENPNNQYFDSSLVWGPIFGRMIYLGMRYKWL